MDNIAIYPGTFDPPTNGHIDIVRRSLRMFEKVIVAISVNPAKTPMFSFDERKQFFMDEFEEERLSFVSFDKELLVSFSKKVGAQVIIRGLRAVSDFDFEFQMSHINRALEDKMETVFLMTDTNYSYLSSSLVKQLASLNGELGQFVPLSIETALKEKYNG